PREGEGRLSCALLHRLAVQVDVEALDLDLRVDAEADEDIDQLEDDQRDHGVVDRDHQDALDLADHLKAVALDPSRRSAVSLDGEDAGENGADGAPDGMDAEGVERVVIPQGGLEPG